MRTDDGVPVFVEQIPPKDGPAPGTVPLVLLHGLSQQRHYWNPVIRRLPHRSFVVLDQRGHGQAATDDVTAESDFSIDRLAQDVAQVLETLEIEQAIIVGHSWGASVALRTAARYPQMVRSQVLIDGGLFGPRHLTSDALTAAQVREALRPPPLGLLEPALWQAISGGDLSPYWSSEVQAALAPTFRVDDAGRAFTNLGMDRHMAVLDGLIAYDPAPDIAAVGAPSWVVSCEPRGYDTTDASLAQDSVAEDDAIGRAWALARNRSLADLPRPFFVQRWAGALHDVPLQWPALVAGLLETVAERIEPPREEVS